MAEVTRAQLAATAALVDQYAQQRQARTAAAVTLIVAAWRRWLLGGGSARPGRAAAAATAAALRLSREEFAASVTPAMADRFYDEDAVTALARDLAQISAQAQQQLSALTQQFERVALSRAARGSPAPTVPRQGGAGQILTSRRDVDPVAVYARPAAQLRYQRSEQRPLPEVVAQAETRASRLIEDDLTLAVRDAFEAIVNHRNSDATGYRRVLRPELAKYGSCGLCIAASDRIYSREELLPIHARCNCIVLPIVGDNDPGQSINAADLERLYVASGDTTDGQALKRVRATVQDNGELGPVLVRYGQHFLTPEEAEERRREARTPPATDR